MQPRRLLFPALTVPLLCGLLISLPFPVNAAPPATRAKPARKKAAPPASRSANVKRGEIVALDADHATLTVKDNGGQTTTYRLSDKLRCFKAGRSAQPADFN